MTTPTPTLGEAGRELHKRIADGFELSGAEARILLEASRTADELDRIETELAAATSLTTTGSTGQLVAHPLLAEIRRHREVLGRLLGQLIDHDDDGGKR